MFNGLIKLLRSLFGLKEPEEDELREEPPDPVEREPEDETQETETPGEETDDEEPEEQEDDPGDDEEEPDNGSPDDERGDEELELPESPLTYDGNEGARTLGVAVYQTTGLTERFGRIPETNVGRFLGQALRHAGYNYEIVFGLDPLNLPEDASGETLSTFSAHSREGEHLNILLGDRTGGGLAYGGAGYRGGGAFWSGRYCLGPAGNINEVVELVENAPANPEAERLWINLRASALHEPGHTLGGNHSDVMTDPDWQDYPQNEKAPSMLFNNVEAGWMDSPPPTL